MQLKNTLFIVFSFFFVSVNAQVIYVDSLAQGNNTGDSWEHAFTDLHDALNIAEYGNEIWIAKGTYFTTQSLDMEIFFELKTGVSLYGGFDGTETEKSQRDWESNKTRISGNLGDPTDINDNAFTIFYMENPDTANIVDGLMMENANAGKFNISIISTAPGNNGGAFYIEITEFNIHTRPVFRNCSFQTLIADGSGGSIYFENPTGLFASALVENCFFLKYTQARDAGGAIYLVGGSTEYDFIVRDCYFEGVAQGSTHQNSLGQFGGVIRTDIITGTKNVIIENCFFYENWGLGCAGFAGYSNLPTKFLVKNCRFEKQYLSGIDRGGLIEIICDNPDSEFEMTDCQFINNSQPIPDSNLVYLENVGMATLKNCEFSDNKLLPQGTIIELRGTNISLEQCLFSNNFGSVFELAGDNPSQVNVLNSLFYNNQAEDFEGTQEGIIKTTGTSDAHTVHFQNSVFWDNSLREGEFLIDVPQFSGISFQNCLTNVPDCEFINSQNVNCSNNIFNQNPEFTDVSINNFTLLPCSPAKNTGTNTPILQNNIQTDLAGNPRIIAGTVDIGPYEAPEFSAQLLEIIPPDCHGNETGSVEFQFENGCEPYTYEWDNGTTNGTGNTQLAAGDYNFTVTDGAGNLTVLSAVIPEPELLEVFVQHTNVDCQNSVAAEITISSEGGTPPYNFQWNTTQTDSVLTNLPAGEYILTVTDANGCSQTSSIEITNEGNLSLGINVTKITCHDTHDGTATVTPVNGLAPFDFDWENGETDSVLINIGSGTYALTVTDVLGCTDGLSFTIEAPDTLFAEVSGTDISCFGDQNGTAFATAEGGTEPYDFDWNNLMSGDTLTGLSPGEYWVTVTDQNGCRDSVSVSLSEPLELILATDSEGVPCFDLETGWASVTPTGGIMPYEYLWDNNQTDSVLTNLPGGEYPVTVMDANDCAATTEISVHAPSEIILDFESFDVSCFGFDDGTAGVIPSGGTPPFMYEWNNLETDSVITDLSKGNYEVLVTDANDCMTSESIFIDAPDMLIPDSVTVHASSPGTSDGMIIFQILSGGTPPFEYSWNTGDTTPSLSGIPPGEYILNVRDSNDCLTTYVFEVSFMSSVRNLNKMDYLFYPNPVWQSQTVGFSFLNPNFQKGKLSIFDSKGSLIFTEKAVLNSNKIDFKSPETAGVFWVNFESEDGFILTEKLVVLGIY